MTLFERYCKKHKGIDPDDFSKCVLVNPEMKGHFDNAETRKRCSLCHKHDPTCKDLWTCKKCWNQRYYRFKKFK